MYLSDGIPSPTPSNFSPSDTSNELGLDGSDDQGRRKIDRLRYKAQWIRDELEPTIARGGSKYLEADVVLDLNAFFSELLHTPMDRETLRKTRIHKAILLVTEKATRWPGKLIDICDEIVAEWTKAFGKLSDIHPDLYGPEGRLYGIAKSHELSRRELVQRWNEDPNISVSPLKALQHGHLGHTPGKWWIHPVFAYHDGIISSSSPIGGICADSEGAYAITLTNYDELGNDPSAENFVYRIRRNDPARFRLMNSFLPVKPPIRVLRSHTLKSIWSPYVGLRYDGLYKITDWSTRCTQGQWIFEVSLKREPEQVPITKVLRRPLAEDVDDYVEYRRGREQYERGRPIADTAVDTGRRPAFSPNIESAPINEIASGVQTLNAGRRAALCADPGMALLTEASTSDEPYDRLASPAGRTASRGVERALDEGAAREAVSAAETKAVLERFEEIAGQLEHHRANEYLAETSDAGLDQGSESDRGPWSGTAFGIDDELREMKAFEFPKFGEPGLSKPKTGLGAFFKDEPETVDD